MTNSPQSCSAASLDLKPCPFCGSKIKHVESWAKSFNPPRLYHEWHHEEHNPDCQIFRFNGKIVVSSTDDEEMRRTATKRWNARTGDDAQPVAWRFRYENPSGSYTPWAYRAEEPASFPDRQVQAFYASQPSPAATVETRDAIDVLGDPTGHCDAPRPECSAVIDDDELTGWARSWHWNDCLDDKPVDPSIYFRDMRMLKAFIEYQGRAIPTEPQEAPEPTARDVIAWLEKRQGISWKSTIDDINCALSSIALSLSRPHGN